MMFETKWVLETFGGGRFDGGVNAVFDSEESANSFVENYYGGDFKDRIIHEVIYFPEDGEDG